jgi:hypothetical protein
VEANEILCCSLLAIITASPIGSLTPAVPLLGSILGADTPFYFGFQDDAVA